MPNLLYWCQKQKIFKCFMTSSHGSYNWVDAPQKEIIFLNDIRDDIDWGKRVMPWNMFLNLLEGVTINVSMPKNFYAKDYEWTEKQPIFAISDRPILRIRSGSIDGGETQQMAERWVVINFRYQYVGENVNYGLVLCGPCFAKLVLDVWYHTCYQLFCCFTGRNILTFTFLVLVYV